MWWLLIACIALIFGLILMWPHHIGIVWRNESLAVFWRSFPILLTYRNKKIIVKLFGKRIRRKEKGEVEIKKRSESPKEAKPKSPVRSSRSVIKSNSETKIDFNDVNFDKPDNESIESEDSNGKAEASNGKAEESNDNSEELNDNSEELNDNSEDFNDNSEDLNDNSEDLNDNSEDLNDNSEDLNAESDESQSKYDDELIKSDKNDNDQKTQDTSQLKKRATLKSKTPKRSGLGKIRSFRDKIFALWTREKSFILGNKKWLGTFLVHTWNLLKPMSYQIKMRGGFIDPSETGMLYGLCESISHPNHSGTNSYVDFYPKFVAPLDWSYRGKLFWRTSLWKLLVWLSISIITYPWIKAYKFWKRKKEMKKDLPGKK